MNLQARYNLEIQKARLAGRLDREVRVYAVSHGDRLYIISMYEHLAITPLIEQAEAHLAPVMQQIGEKKGKYRAK